jgi:hypothetical protein
VKASVDKRQAKDLPKLAPNPFQVPSSTFFSRSPITTLNFEPGTRNFARRGCDDLRTGEALDELSTNVEASSVESVALNVQG